MTIARIVCHVSFCTSVIVCPLGFGRRSVCRTVVALPPTEEKSLRLKFGACDGTLMPDHLPLKTPARSTRLVSLLWFIPILIEWNRERVRGNGGDVKEFDDSANKLFSELERILGVP